MPNQNFKIIALYKFVSLPDCAALQPVLETYLRDKDIRGTLLLAEEGINGTLAGSPDAIDGFAEWLTATMSFEGRFAGAEIKFSTARTMPFLRLKVRLKPEIVTLRAPEANPAQQAGTYVDPKDWNDLISRHGMKLVDTRNNYEVGLGTFEGAVDPSTKNFTDFKKFVAEKLDPARDKQVAMFCTGGIRCEKASSYLLSQGFEQVFHLKGGILSYLEKVPEADSKWQGECFVFDERVGVRHGLEVGEAELCRACRHPLTPADRGHADYRDGIQCPHCSGPEFAATRAAATERHRQMQLAELRGTAHLGDDAASAARARAKAKKRQREQDRARNSG